MELIYRRKESINTSLADCFGRLRPSALLSIMQEAAGMHCIALGAGRDVLGSRGLFWAVIRQKVEIERLPVIGETMVVETWPGEATHAAYPRYTMAMTESGEILFRAAALWLIMDAGSRAMILPGKSGIVVPGLSRENQLAAPGSLPPVPMSNELTRQVRYSELDVNGHMSNTKYLDWMEDLFPASYHREHPLAEFQISYLSEAREGQEISLRWDARDDGELRLEAIRPGSGKTDRVFALRARYL